MYDSLMSAKWLDNKLEFEKQDWAPGIWAGTEGWKFARLGSKDGMYKITEVDLKNRTLHIKKLD